ncbi:MAG: hypothetical protein AVDCRST_MAG73-1750 [uncultured Thermomicrobiales bacterium]|uniref:Phage holin family protein n=1 Tax=uncultured Thermomicrobiales bacterium TaxID=1645740 RepID=A0A6J4U6A2_9BACT|nr:MAG: hypothetical protein AVDCRST_MAG73-1750 [uncultured Thermomicrobiales bacterium]
MDTSQTNRAGGDPFGREGAGGAPDGYGSLITGVIKDMQDLLRAEVQLAKTELKEDASGIGKGVAFVAGGALVGLVAFIFLMLAATYLLDRWVDRWIAAGIVGLILATIAAIVASTGKKHLSAATLKPEQTIETLKEDQQWAKQQINSVKR